MKVSLKKFKRPHNKHLIAAGLAVFIVISVSGIVLFKTRTAQSVASDDKFRVILPNPFEASQTSDAYLEISQVGTGNTLDAKESWAKVYIDKGRINDTTIGIYKGGYGPGVDSYGLIGSGSNDYFPDNDATIYEFYYGVTTPRRLPGSDAIFYDETHCNKPFASMRSGDMSTTGWSKLAMQPYGLGKCGSIDWDITPKSGKYVVFVKAKWREEPNPTGNGRVNAFKVSAAYQDSKNVYDNPLTGYWSNYDVAAGSERPTTAAYSVQDRISPRGTQGDYVFKFAPDCRLPIGRTETRYLHWKDVDFPEYYSKDYPPYIDQKDPEFDLIEISPSGARSVIKHVDKNTNPYPYNGGNQNSFGVADFTAKGGYKYEWTWKNITRVDGVSFWVPYDDFPYFSGCGSYKQSIGLWGTRGSGWTQSNFTATGGDLLQFFVDEAYAGGTGAAPDTTSNAYLKSQGGATFDGTFVNDNPTPGGAINISDGGRRVGRAQVQWKLPGMGPQSPYTSRRWLLFSYQIKSNAQNGAVHCFNADMTPKSNADPLGILTSNTICVTIDNSLKPYLRTSGGDVHAGDCVVTTAGNGKITGPQVNGLNIGSSGSYVVSAGDKITDFGSGNSPRGTGLTFGKTGYYGSMCRPRLSEADVDKAIAAGAVEVPFSGSTLNASLINGLPDDKKYVVKLPAGTSVSGTFKRSVTLYSRGDINIVGNIGGDTGVAYSRDKLPVVGILSESDIKISPGVTKIDALLYALDDIDTCSGQNIKTAGGVAACKPALNLNGFAMAKSFSFKRTTGSAGLVKAEDLIFNAAFYLNPPPVFGTAAGAVKFLGERAPLY